ncbi:hypothetical protein BV20DRAFT_972657 [Pilatotrama ljubarskyi]|nr:hypothetical protein BV20DRAFT_972657 [Pilatotrama ljubarskyi]
MYLPISITPVAARSGYVERARGKPPTVHETRAARPLQVTVPGLSDRDLTGALQTECRKAHTERSATPQVGTGERVLYLCCNSPQRVVSWARFKTSSCLAAWVRLHSTELDTLNWTSLSNIRDHHARPWRQTCKVVTVACSIVSYRTIGLSWRGRGYGVQLFNLR